VSDDLPSAWRLQSVLLGSGLLPRTVQTADLAALRDVPADIVVFDRGVSGAAAIGVLDRVRPPGGASAPPALFLVDAASAAASVPGERRLVAPVADETLRSAVEELMRATPRPEPRVMPPIEEIDLAGALDQTPLVVLPRRRRPGLIGLIGPVLALAGLIGLVGAYSALLAGQDRPADPATPAPAASAPASFERNAPAATSPAATPTVPPAAVPAPPTVAPGPHPATPRPGGTRHPAGTGPGERVPGTGPTGAVGPAATVAQPTVTPARPPSPSPSPQLPAPDTGLEGRVIDMATGAALSGAVVSYHGPASGETTTAGDGRYRIIALPSGAYVIAASAPGYAASTNRAGVVEGVVTTDNLALQPSGPAPVAPFESVLNRQTGQPVAVYGYRVHPGDTLRDIAERAGTTVAEILAVNRLDDPDHLEPGQVIYLPASTFGHK
jgi:LysM repeat protein